MVTLMDKRRLKVFEKGVLRKKFGIQKDEVTWEWRKVQMRSFMLFYSSQNIIRMTTCKILWWADIQEA